MQVDAEKIELFMPQINVLWDGAFQVRPDNVCFPLWNAVC